MNDINLKLEFPLGSTVYYKTDANNLPGMIVGVLFNLNNSYAYRVSFNGDIHYCYEEELRDHKNYV